jgi:hypothetical protein
MDNQTLIFLHIPKTAGTTLNRIIEWQYNPLAIFTMDPYRIRATPERLRTLSEARRRGIKMVRGHFYYGLHDLLPQGGTYMTVLREPVARFLSAYYFLQRRPLHPMHRKVTSERIGVEDFIRLTPHRQNLQTSMLAGIKSNGTCEDHVLEVAKENLTKSFSVIGLCERFEESLMLMAATYGWEIPFYENRKVAKSRPKIEARAIEMIKEHNRLDLELYEFARQLFEASLARRKTEVEAGLVRLRSLPQPSAFRSFYQSTVGAGRFFVSKIASAV